MIGHDVSSYQGIPSWTARQIQRERGQFPAKDRLLKMRMYL